MKKSLNLSIYLPIFLSFSLNGQVSNSQEKEENVGIKLNSIYNLEEIKVRWKKVALENCPVVPCIIVPPPPPPPSFTCGTSTISDLDGNIYNTVLIGTQCWTKQNLKVTKYNNGTVIPDETANTAGWGGLATGARSDYTGEASYIATYGYLYNWYAATDSRKICPAGWHVPTDGEWTSLIQFIDPSASAGGFGNQSNTAGSKLKSTGNWPSGTGLWGPLNADADNSTNFSALPGGARSNSFTSKTANGWFLSSSARSDVSNTYWNRRFNLNDGVVEIQNDPLTVGLSVRCLRD